MGLFPLLPALSTTAEDARAGCQDTFRLCPRTQLGKIHLLSRAASSRKLLTPSSSLPSLFLLQNHRTGHARFRATLTFAPRALHCTRPPSSSPGGVRSCQNQGKAAACAPRCLHRSGCPTLPAGAASPPAAPRGLGRAFSLFPAGPGFLHSKEYVPGTSTPISAAL